MISDDCQLEEFLKVVRGKPIREAIKIANQEATEAERLQLLRDSKQESRNPGCSQYTGALKEFIRYIRYAVKPRIGKDEKLHLFDAYLKSAEDRFQH